MAMKLITTAHPMFNIMLNRVPTLSDEGKIWRRVVAVSPQEVISKELNLGQGSDTTLRLIAITPKPAGVSKLPIQKHHLEWAVSPIFLAWLLVHQKWGR
jgi:hypothetical protein